MTTYRVAEGSNIALVSLTVLSPQPRSEGVRATRRDFIADGSIVEQGLYVELVYDVLNDVTEYQAVLAFFGLDTADSAAVTIYARNALFNFVRYNGRAVRPEPSWQQFFPRNVVILVKNLQVVA